MGSPEMQEQSSERLGGDLKQIEAMLKDADQRMKDGDLDGALELIRQAQAQDRRNVYGLAYVERIQALMRARKAKGQPTKGSSQWAPASFAKKVPPSASVDPPRQNTERSESRTAAMKAAVDTILGRAREHIAAKDFERAKQELERARLLDPVNEEVPLLEAETARLKTEEDAKLSELQEKRQKDDQNRHREILEQELTRVRQQKEEQRRKSDEARRTAQELKIQQYLQLAAKYLEAEKFEEASGQLAFVVVIDPLNAGAAELQRKIREAQEQKRQAELELRRRKEAEEKQRRDAVHAAVKKNIETATALASTKKFAEALRLITRAYMLDPVSDEVRACEQGILEAQEEEHRAAEQQRRIQEEEARLRREDELRRMTEAERDKLLREEESQQEREKSLNKEKVSKHLASAREHLGSLAFHDALAEVAQAFALDPFDEDVKKVEQEILEVQRAGESSSPPPATGDVEKPPEAEIERFIDAARQLQSRGEYARALDELTKAFVLDPLNEAVRALEAEIEGEYLSLHQKGDTGRQKDASQIVDELQHTLTDLTEKFSKSSGGDPNEQQAKLNYHISRARRLTEGGSPEDALAEVALGLTIDPDNAELRALEAAIWEQQTESESVGTMDQGDDSPERRIKAHLAAAEELQTQGELARALDEIAKAYQLDPLNEAVRERENAIRQDEMRRTQAGESQLKLVYPRRGAAGGGA